MLRVTVELIPGGDESRRREIGRMDIVNTGDHPAHPVLGDYHAMVTTVAANGDIHASNRHIVNYERLRWTAWGLIYTVLEALGVRGMEGEDDQHGLSAGS